MSDKAKFIVEIEFSKRVCDDLHAYMQVTTDGRQGFFNVLEENLDSVVKSMDPSSSVSIVEVRYDA